MNLPDTDYAKRYETYRNLPAISSIILGVLVLIWSIVDVATFGSYYSYGIMRLESAGMALFIWWAIGAVLCALTYYLTSLSIAPTIVRTDAVLEINKKLDKE